MTQETSLSQKDVSAIVALSVFLAGLIFLVTLIVNRQRRRTRRRRAERMASINLQGFRDGGEDHNDEFAVESRLRAGIHRIMHTFPAMRSRQRKSSVLELRKQGGLRGAQAAPTRTLSFVAERTPSFAVQNTPTLDEGEVPRSRTATVSLTPLHVQREHPFRLQRKPGIRLGYAAADQGDEVDNGDSRPRIRRSDSIERDWKGWEMAHESESNGVERKSSDRSLEMVSTSRKGISPTKRRGLRRNKISWRSQSDEGEASTVKIPTIAFV